MNADLSHLLEQALQYATPLPTSQKMTQEMPRDEVSLPRELIREMTDPPKEVIGEVRDQPRKLMGQTLQKETNVEQIDKPPFMTIDQINFSSGQTTSIAGQTTSSVSRCDVGCMTDHVIILDAPYDQQTRSVGINESIQKEITQSSTPVEGSSSSSDSSMQATGDLIATTKTMFSKPFINNGEQSLPQVTLSQCDILNTQSTVNQTAHSPFQTLQAYTCDNSHDSGAFSSPCPSMTSSDPDSLAYSPATYTATSIAGDSVSASAADSSSDGNKQKRKRKREKLTCSPTPIVLPPCRICDEKSSGYHYGANTCEACKGFFRRTLKKSNITFKCKCTADEKAAWKSGPSKNGCPACRYARCLAIGMSRNAIKIGRYTLDHKTDNIKEVKSLEAMDTVIEQAIAQVDITDVPSFSPLSLLSSRESEMSPGESSSSSVMAESPRPAPLATGMSEKEMRNMIEACHAAHLTYQKTEHQPEEAELFKTQLDYLENFLQRQKTFGNMKPLSREEYIDFYKVTGMDIDGRLGNMEQALAFFEKKISYVVQFAKGIPGFNDLSLNDQASLVKASRMENMLVGTPPEFDKRINMDLQVVTTPWGHTLHLSEVGIFVPKEFIVERFKARRMLRNLQLSEEEISVYRAFLITASDRCELEGKEKVEALHNRLLSCLQHLLQQRPSSSSNIFYQLCNLMTQLRTVSNNDNHCTKKMLDDWPMLANYELFREFIG